MENSFEYNKQFGCFQIARSLLHDELWLMKPAWWCKVWIYIIGKANHTNYNDKIKRGDLLTSYHLIYTDCNLAVEDIKEGAIDNVIRFLKEVKGITTRKTTRGLIITVLNYDLYQTISNFKNDTENEIQTKPQRNRHDTETTRINNNDNNERIKKKDTNESLPNISSDADLVFAHYLTVSKTNEKLLPSRKRKIQSRLKTFTVEEMKTAIDNCFADGFYNGLSNERGWRANANYIFRSDEVIDKHLNTTKQKKDVSSTNENKGHETNDGMDLETVKDAMRQQNEERRIHESY